MEPRMNEGASDAFTVAGLATPPRVSDKVVPVHVAGQTKTQILSSASVEAHLEVAETDLRLPSHLARGADREEEEETQKPRHSPTSTPVRTPESTGKTAGDSRRLLLRTRDVLQKRLKSIYAERRRRQLTVSPASTVREIHEEEETAKLGGRGISEGISSTWSVPPSPAIGGTEADSEDALLREVLNLRHQVAVLEEEGRSSEAGEMTFAAWRRRLSERLGSRRGGGRGGGSFSRNRLASRRGSFSSSSSLKSDPAFWLPLLLAAVIGVSLFIFDRSMRALPPRRTWEVVDSPMARLEDMSQAQKEKLFASFGAEGLTQPTQVHRSSSSPMAARGDRLDKSDFSEVAQRAWLCLGSEQRNWFLEDRGLKAEEVELLFQLASGSEEERGISVFSTRETPSSFFSLQTTIVPQRTSLSSLRRSLSDLTLQIFTRRVVDQSLRRPFASPGFVAQQPLEREAQLLLLRIAKALASDAFPLAAEMAEALRLVVNALQEEDFQIAEDVRLFAERLSGLSSGGGAAATSATSPPSSSPSSQETFALRGSPPQRTIGGISRVALFQELSELRASLAAVADKSERSATVEDISQRLGKVLSLAVRWLSEQRKLARLDEKIDATGSARRGLKSASAGSRLSSFASSLEAYTDPKGALRSVIAAALGSAARQEDELLTLLRMVLLLL